MPKDFKIGDRIIVTNYIWPELNGMMGEVVCLGWEDNMYGIQFGCAVGELTHSLGGTLSGRTGRYIHERYLFIASNEWDN